MTEYTKGEWNRLGWLIVDENEALIADCRPKKPASVFESYATNLNTSIDEITANAQLIASAPDLYEALKASTNREVDTVKWAIMVSKALAKAEGKK